MNSCKVQLFALLLQCFNVTFDAKHVIVFTWSHLLLWWCCKNSTRNPSLNRLELKELTWAWNLQRCHFRRIFTSAEKQKARENALFRNLECKNDVMHAIENGRMNAWAMLCYCKCFKHYAFVRTYSFAQWMILFFSL